MLYPETLNKEILKGSIHPVYFFCGENTYLMDKAVAAIKKQLFGSGDADLDFISFDAQLHGPPEIIQQASTLPFFGKKRLVVVKRAHVFKLAQWKAFKACIARPPDSCCLVFICEDSRQKGSFLNELKKKAVVVSFSNPRNETSLKKFIKEQLRRNGKNIDEKALSYFVSNAGLDARAVAAEVEKLCLLCANRRSVGVEDLEALLCRSHNTTIFKLLEEIGRGRLDVSLAYLDNMCKDNIPPLVVIKMISRQFRLISTARDGLSKGEPVSAIARQLKARFNVGYANSVSDIVSQAKGWSSAGLGMAFEEIFRSNILIKSSRIEKKMILENLVFRLADLRNQPCA